MLLYEQFIEQNHIKEKKMKKTWVAVLTTIFLMPVMVSVANASTTWTDWTDRTAGAAGSAVGTLGTITVDYSGEVLGNTNLNGTSNIWNPDTTYIGGLIDTSPDTVGDVIGLNGSTSVSTISFSEPVLNPVIAIWSLGRPSFEASFSFTETPVFQVGGPNSIYGGSSIIVDGNTVAGNEGNGVILFEGEFDSLSWTSTNENWYGFTVGSTSVPVPGAIWLLGSGFAGLAGIRIVRRVDK
jgi:hypothetical protein